MTKAFWIATAISFVLVVTYITSTVAYQVSYEQARWRIEELEREIKNKSACKWCGR